MTAGFQNEPSFNLFIPSYVQSTESFVLRLPETYGRVLLTLQPFTAGDKVKYRLEPTAGAWRWLLLRGCSEAGCREVAGEVWGAEGEEAEDGATSAPHSTHNDEAHCCRQDSQDSPLCPTV